MSTRVDVEQIEVTRGEKLLAVLLAAFLLIGGLWAYFELDRDDGSQEFRPPTEQLSSEQQATLQRRDNAVDEAAAAGERVRIRRRELVDRREAYRTTLDAGAPDPALEQRYRGAQRAYADAQDAARRLRAEARAARADAAPVERELRRIERAQIRDAEDRDRRDELITAALRLVLVVALLIVALVVMARQRRRRSRWVLTGYAGVGAAGALALVMGVDYVDGWVDPTDLEPLVLAVAGTAATLVAIAALQRHLARRLPGRRVRRGECPFCGYPTGRGEHCEGCGRAVLAPCARCAAPRRVGTAHCAACGEV